jgi:hypothetical protein
MKIIKFIKNNSNTNILVFHIDMIWLSNRAIQVFNYKLKTVGNSFDYVTIMECNCNREYFAKHICILIDEVRV